MSGLPLFTEAITKSLTPAADLLSLTVFWPTTVNILITLAPELSQVPTSAPVGSALVTLAFNGCIFPSFGFFSPFFLFLLFFLKGLPSLILTMSPSFASIHLGLCAFILVLLRSSLSYFGRKYFQDHSTVTVLCIFADTTVPVKVLPLHF